MTTTPTEERDELARRFDLLAQESAQRSAEDAATIDQLRATLRVPPGCTLVPPSHVTLIQASRILHRLKQTVHYQARPGGPLQAETWHGVRMIPMFRVMLELAKKEAKP